MNCKNCGEKLEGKFCSNCGQSSSVGRINYSNLLQEISSSVFQINNGFFYTLRELFIRPGDSLREFLEGKRARHFKPIAYVLTLSTIYFLIVKFTNHNTWIDDLISGFLSGAEEAHTSAEVPKVLVWFTRNYAYSTLLLLPVFSLASYISFYKKGINYFEHIVINSYVTGQQAIFYSFFALLANFIESDFMESLPVLVAVYYTCLVFWQFFKKGNRVVNVLRSLLTYLLYLIFSLTLLFATMGISEI